MKKKKRIYNFFESGDNHSEDYSPKITIDPTIRGESKFRKNVDTIILNLKNGETMLKTFSSNGLPLVASTKKNGGLIISN